MFCTDQKAVSRICDYFCMFRALASLSWSLGADKLSYWFESSRSSQKKKKGLIPEASRGAIFLYDVVLISR